MRLITRAQAGLRAPRSISRNITSEGVTGHWGGGALGWPWDHSRCASIWRAWQAFHMDQHGWSDLAYSMGACPHGYVLEGRGAGVRTAANGTNDGNLRSHAVVYLGGDGDEFTAEGKQAMHDAITYLRDRGAGSRLWRHFDWKGTACPGSAIADWIVAGASGSGATFPAGQPAPAPRMGGPLVAVMYDRDGRGYYEVAADGGVFAFEAPFFGSMGGQRLNKPIVDAALTPSGGGYWLVAEDGGIFSFGDAHFYGSTGAIQLNKPVRSIAPTPSGGGYVLGAEDGGIFAFGDAAFVGRAEAA